MPSGTLQSLPFHPPKQAQLPSHGWHFPWQEHVTWLDGEYTSAVKHSACGFALGQATLGFVSTFSILLQTPTPNSDFARTDIIYFVAISKPVN